MWCVCEEYVEAYNSTRAAALADTIAAADDYDHPVSVHQHEGTEFHFPDDWQGSTTALRWHIEHLLDPQSMSPGSAMTRFPMTKKEAAGLALLVMSWRRQSLPPAWTPKKQD